MTKSPILLAICGMAGSGKTTAREYFQNKGFEYIKFGVTELVLKKYGEVTEALEKVERVALREEKGMGVMAQIAMPRLKQLLTSGKNVVIDNMYSWSEYKLLKEEFKDQFVTLAILANPELRYNRLLNRKEESGRSYSSTDEVKGRDYSEIEAIEKGGPIAMADFYIVNEGSEEELAANIEKFYNRITA